MYRCTYTANYLTICYFILYLAGCSMEEERSFSKWVATKVWSMFGWCCQVSSCHTSVLTTGFFALHVLLILSGYMATNSSPAQGNSIIALIMQILYIH